MEKKTILGITLLVCLVGVIAVGIAETLQLQVTNHGNITVVNGLSSSVSNFAWGSMANGSSEWNGTSITNTGNTPVTLSITNNTAIKCPYMSLSCNYTGTKVVQIDPEKSTFLNFTLYAAPNSPAGPFGFNITIAVT